MYNIIYIGNKREIEIDKISQELSVLNNNKITIIREKDIESGINHLFFETSVCLVIFEDGIPDLENTIKEFKQDEEFKFTPIIIMLDENDKEIKRRYYLLGVDSFIQHDFTTEEIIFLLNSLVKHKIRQDNINSQLREVSEKNITKAIQLDLLKKFIPCTVWEKTENLAESQNFEIPEEEQDLAILFGDLESFTTIAEKLAPKKVIEMLNGIFDITTQIIYQNFGDIDKFIGDAFLAVFKSPEMALLSAITIQDEIISYNDKKKENNQCVSNFRLGIHYGKVIRGSVGGTVRFDNTLIGDSINTSQRLQTMSPAPGILASKEVISKVEELRQFNITYNTYTLKGKNKDIEACLFYNFYKEHPEIKDILFKIRKRINIENERKI